MIRCVNKITYLHLASSRSRDRNDITVARTKEKTKDDIKVEVVLKDREEKAKYLLPPPLKGI